MVFPLSNPSTEARLLATIAQAPRLTTEALLGKLTQHRDKEKAKREESAAFFDLEITRLQEELDTAKR